MLVAAALSASCATAPPKYELATATDDVVASHIYSALNADPWFYFRHVDVNVDNGVAYLTGYVWSADAIYRARLIASRTPGVTRVVSNQLELDRNGRSTGPAR
jgi:osmotically-inducible protein OsmY